MRILRNGDRTVFVASGPGGSCPTASTTSGAVKFRDDFNASSITTRKQLALKLFSGL